MTLLTDFMDDEVKPRRWKGCTDATLHALASLFHDPIMDLPPRTAALASAIFCDEGTHDLDTANCKPEKDVVAIFNVCSMAEGALNLHKKTSINILKITID